MPGESKKFIRLVGYIVRDYGRPFYLSKKVYGLSAQTGKFVNENKIKQKCL